MWIAKVMSVTTDQEGNEQLYATSYWGNESLKATYKEAMKACKKKKVIHENRDGRRIGSNYSYMGQGSGRGKESNTGNRKSRSGTWVQLLAEHLQKLSGQMGSVQTGDQAVLRN